MKQFIEEKIKSSFLKWDEQKTDIGFDKDKIWQKLHNETNSTRSYYIFSRVVAIVIFLFVISGWLCSFHQNKQLKIKYSKMAEETGRNIDSLKSLIAEVNKDSIVRTIIKYRTIVKKVESPELKTKYMVLQKKYMNSKTMNIELERKLAKYEELYCGLNDSINILISRIKKADQVTLLSNKISEEQIDNKDNALAFISTFEDMDTKVRKTKKRRFKIKFGGEENYNNPEDGFTKIKF